MFLKSLLNGCEVYSISSAKLKPPSANTEVKVNFYSLEILLKQLLLIAFYSFQPSAQTKSIYTSGSIKGVSVPTQTQVNTESFVVI